jgi:hypothetical protein
MANPHSAWILPFPVKGDDHASALAYRRF